MRGPFERGSTAATSKSRPRRIWAALFSAAAEVGAAIVNRPAPEQTALKSYARDLGLAFQLVDDALDYSGDSANLGKSVAAVVRDGAKLAEKKPEEAKSAPEEAKSA